jgi:xanthine dehydrogenase accessory factor
MNIFQLAQARQAAGEAFALVSVLRVQAPTSARPGDKALVSADGVIEGWIGGGCAQPAVIKAARLAMADGQARTIRITPSGETVERTLDDVLEFGMSCHSGGTLELFIDPVLPPAALLVLGDSPVAQALVKLAPQVGLQVHAQASVQNGESLPRAPWVVVATQGRGDIAALRGALGVQARAVWFVASARKAQVLKDNLKTSGENAASVDAIIAPAGRLVGAQTPEEIALSVLFDVVAQRRNPQDISGVSAVNRASANVNSEVNAIENVATPVASCCGGKAKAAQAKLDEKLDAMVSAAVDTQPEMAQVAAPVVTKKSCCGG